MFVRSFHQQDLLFDASYTLKYLLHRLKVFYLSFRTNVRNLSPNPLTEAARVAGVILEEPLCNKTRFLPEFTLSLAEGVEMTIGAKPFEVNTPIEPNYFRIVSANFADGTLTLVYLSSR